MKFINNIFKVKLIFISLLAIPFCKTADPLHAASRNADPVRSFPILGSETAIVMTDSANLDGISCKDIVSQKKQGADFQGDVFNVAKTIAATSAWNYLTRRDNVGSCVELGAITGGLFLALKYGYGIPNLRFRKPGEVIRHNMFAVEYGPKNHIERVNPHYWRQW